MMPELRVADVAWRTAPPPADVDMKRTWMMAREEELPAPLGTEGHHGYLPGGGTAAVASPSAPGRFALSSVPDPDDPTKSVTMLVNCYYDIGGKTYMIPDQPVPPQSGASGGFVCLKLAATGSVQFGTVVFYSSIPELQEAQEDRMYYVIPLYKMDKDGNVLVDFRLGPSASQGEF